MADDPNSASTTTSGRSTSRRAGRMPSIRDLQADGVIRDDCLPFAGLTLARRCAAANPATPLVMDLRGSNQGAWLVVSEADAVRMRAAGFDLAPEAGPESPLSLGEA